MLCFKRFIVVSLLVVATVQPVYAVNNHYFSCQKGYQFESKRQAARCIKQQKLTYRSTEACRKKGNFKLKVDTNGLNDLCVANMPNKKSFIPICNAGYKLQAKRGKDNCAKGNPEIIKPPSKKVKR